MSFIIRIICIILCITTVEASEVDKHSKTLRWLGSKSAFFQQKIMDNISPPDGLPGTVVAARRDKTGPDYHYHWVRDAGIVMLTLIDNYENSSDEKEKTMLRQTIFNYLDFSTHIQNVPKIADLGEPKFYLDGRAYDKEWGRPQNDGPALRAISLIAWSNTLLRENQEYIVRERLYNPSFPANSPIKKDLEYISHHWKDPSFDLWEEEQGTHFYTLMVIRRALLEGAVLAERMHDTNAAHWYYLQGKQVELELENFWNDEKGYITATINHIGGINYKYSNLDTAVILGLLHGGMHDGFLDWDNPHVTATLNRLTNTFASLYPINQLSVPGVAIGRYPEDRYGGDHFNGGNPWPLCTLALAEAWYQTANLNSRKHQPNTEALLIADNFVQRVRFHAYQDGSMDEQIQRDTGYMTSAHDLTWNYAAILSAKKAAINAIRD